jgi:eukaryotic-like serine/threonine-protein kinase
MGQSLGEGALVARYRIVDRLGAGGMGEVYSAHDPTLDRRVAIKILPPSLVAREDRVRRFVQEAKSASALSHPNIVTIHEIGESESGHYIAMELVDGETLKTKIYADKRSLRELLGWLAQAADGLAKAHAAGIVHRDLKPDNIMVTRDGFAKVLDFGLAKLTERGPEPHQTNIATQVREETKEGTVLGTVGYMAPEQVEGKAVDARADVFSFGCILYEAIARQKPFTGGSDVDVMHKILHADPPSITSLAPETPGELRRIVRRCLAKDPDRRYQSMKDLAIELRDLVNDFDEVTSGSGSSPSMIGVAASRRAMWPWIVAAGAVVVAIVAVAAVLMARRRQPAPASNMTLKTLTSNGKATIAAVSPDGRYLVYTLRDKGLRTVFLKQIATGSEVAILPPSETRGTYGFAFTRDGNYLYITLWQVGSVKTRLVVVPTLGGTPREILEDLDSGPALSPDEKSIAFVRYDYKRALRHLVVASADGTGQRIILTRGGPLDFMRSSTPAWSPDGKWIAISVGTFRGALQNNVLLVSTDGKQTKELLKPWWFYVGDMAWLPDGSELVIAAQKVEAPAAQLHIVNLDGEARRLTNDFNGYGSISVTGDGKTIVALQLDQRVRAWKQSGGTLTALTNEEKHGPGNFSLGPDGSLVYQSFASGNLDAWRLMPEGNRLQLTTHPRADYGNPPVITRDGRHIIFETERSGTAELWMMDADGANQRRIAELGFDITFDVSPDAKEIAFGHENALWRLSTAGGSKPQKIADYALGGRPAYSPDGKWLAIFFRKSSDTALPQLGVMPSGGGEARVLAPLPDDTFRASARWTADGKALIYGRVIKGVANVWLQPLDGTAARPLTNFDSGDVVDAAWSQDGKELVMTRATNINDVVAITDFR